MALTRAASREILRAAVFLWKTPLVTPRISSGWAARRASRAESLLPDAIASSTLRNCVRMRERRALLTARRRSFWRARFLDWGVFAMDFRPLLGFSIYRSHVGKPETGRSMTGMILAWAGCTRM